MVKVAHVNSGACAVDLCFALGFGNAAECDFNRVIISC